MINVLARLFGGVEGEVKVRIKSRFPVRLGTVLFAATSLLASCSGSVWAQHPLDGTIFDVDRLEMSRNTERVFDFYRCHCLGVVERNEEAILHSSRIHATNIYVAELGITDGSYQIEFFLRSGSYRRLFDFLGVGFGSAQDEASSNFVVDYGWTRGGAETSAGDQLYVAPAVCVVDRSSERVSVRINGQAASQFGDSEFGEIAKCYSVGILAVLGFEGFAQGEPFDVGVSDPPDLNHRIVYRGSVIGFMQSFETQCAMALFRLLPNGSQNARDYFEQSIEVSEATRGWRRNSCLPTRGVPLERLDEWR